MPNMPDENEDALDAYNRRKPMAILVEAAVRVAMEKHEDKAKQHLDSRFDELKAIMTSAFPEGDPVGHRQYHQKQIDYMNERMSLWKDIRSKSIIGILWLMLGFVGMAVLEYAKRKVLE